MAERGWAYIDGDAEVKDPDAEEEADDDAYARGEVLGDVIGVVDAHCNQYPAQRLESNSCPYDTVVAVEESIPGDFFSVFENDANDQGRK